MMKTLSLFLIVLLLDACAPQFYRQNELRNQYYTRMPDAEWCARMKNEENWTPLECPRG